MLQIVDTSMSSRMRLYDERQQRLYINQAERERFLTVTNNATLPVQALGLTLLYTGCRLSEALNLSTASIDPESQLISFRTLKKRDRQHIRELPIPPVLGEILASLKEWRLHHQPNGEHQALPLFTHAGQSLNRITGYRWIKRLMVQAHIYGPQGSPKGLRHGYGVHALRMGIPLNLLSRWMGHASMSTTAIYGNAVGSEEMEIAGRMWG